MPLITEMSSVERNKTTSTLFVQKTQIIGSGWKLCCSEQNVNDIFVDNSCKICNENKRNRIFKSIRSDFNVSTIFQYLLNFIFFFVILNIPAMCHIFVFTDCSPRCMVNSKFISLYAVV